MSERSIRVNELILRELSHILRTRFREQTVSITLTEVSISPDLRSGRVYYSVIGDEQAKIKARSFFTKEYRTLRQLVAQKVILKYFPKFNFMEDDSIARGNRVLDLLGEIDGQAVVDRNLPFDEQEPEDGDEGGEYEFDEDDLEYARDVEAEGNLWGSFTGDESEESEEFDEESDVEYDGDPEEDSEDDDDDEEDFDEDDDFGDDEDDDDEDLDDQKDSGKHRGR